MEQELLNRLLAMLVAPEKGWPVSASAQVEIVPYREDNGRLCFVLNHGREEALVRVPLQQNY